MTPYEKKLRKIGRQRVAQVLEGIVPVATQVYYTPQYQKQKDTVAPKFPLKKIIDKEELLDIQQAMASGNGSDAAEKLRDLNSRLTDFEARLFKR